MPIFELANLDSLQKKNKNIYAVIELFGSPAISSATPRCNRSHRVLFSSANRPKWLTLRSALPLHAVHRLKMDDAYTIPTAAHAMQLADKPESIDLSHHLSELAKARISSPLKVRLGVARWGAGALWN